jgi:hypothetical protein
MSKGKKTKKEGIEFILTGDEVEFILDGLDLLKKQNAEHRKEIEKIQTDLIIKKTWQEQTGGIFDMFQ